MPRDHDRTTRSGVRHACDPRPGAAARGAGHAQRPDLPDLDLPVRHLRRLRRDDQLPPARLHVHARLRQPHAPRVRTRDGRARGDRVGALVRVGDGGDPHGRHDPGRERRHDRGEQRAVRRHLLAVRARAAALRDRRAVRRPARPGRGPGGAARRDDALRRDDREPERDRVRPGGARTRSRRPPASRARSTTRSRRRTCARRRRSGSTTSCTRRPSTSAATTT